MAQIDTGPHDASAERVIEHLGRHASCRRYREDADVPEQDIRRIIAAGQRAATSSNLQMWSAVVVRDPADRERLAHLCGDQKHIRQAPVFVAWCADRSRLDRAAARRGYRQNTDYVESFLVAAVDTAIAMQNATVALEAMGYGSCYIGGLRNNTAEVIDLLRLPEHVFPIAGMTLGVPAKASRPRPRLALDAVLHWDRHGGTDDGLLDEYDESMRKTGIYQGRQVVGERPDGSPAGTIPDEEYGWLEHSARRVSRASRIDLRSVIDRQGYRLQ